MKIKRKQLDKFSFTVAEYAAQLPAEGGAFYHVDTIESARPHYKKSWPSILHALAIWLKEAGFAKLNKEAGKEKGDTTTVPDNIPVNMLSEEANAERLYLITGKYSVSGNFRLSFRHDKYS